MMGWWVIGHAGGPARLLLRGPADVAQAQIGEGECSVSVAGIGEWMIADDGASATAIDPSVDCQWMDIRRRRDVLLADCDWTQLPDVPEQTRNAWAPYRQALRDITRAASPAEVVWPIAPDAQAPAATVAP